jgi:hypothetical protein
MNSQERGGNYSAIVNDLLARRAALDSAITKLQTQQAGCNSPSRHLEADLGKRPGSEVGGAEAN